MAASKWMTVGTVLKMNAIHYPGKLGWQDKFQEYSFKAWNERSCRLANGLKDLGVGHRDSFAVIAFNRGEWMDLYAGSAKGGQIIVPVMFRLAAAEIEYIVNHSECRAFVVEEPFVELVNEIRATLSIPENAYIYLGEGPVPDGYLGYEAWLNMSSPDEPDLMIDGEDTWTIMLYLRNHRTSQGGREDA